MRDLAAPFVIYPVGRSTRAAVVMVLLWAAALALQLAWFLVAAPSEDGPKWGWLVLAGATAALAWQWARPPRGQIVWDETWTWRSNAYPEGTPLDWPEVVLDAQQLMLVRLRNADGATWTLWLDAGAQPQSWLGLRRALLAVRRPAGRDDPSLVSSPSSGRP